MSGRISYGMILAVSWQGAIRSKRKYVPTLSAAAWMNECLIDAVYIKEQKNIRTMVRWVIILCDGFPTRSRILVSGLEKPLRQNAEVQVNFENTRISS